MLPKSRPRERPETGSWFGLTLLSMFKFKLGIPKWFAWTSGFWSYLLMFLLVGRLSSTKGFGLCCGGGLSELDSYDPIALVAAEKSSVSPQLQVLMNEFPDVLTGDWYLPKEPAKLEAMKIGLKEGANLTVASLPEGGEKVYGRVRPEVTGRRFIVPYKSPTASPVVVSVVGGSKRSPPDCVCV
jgi:hypothetical protein